MYELPTRKWYSGKYDIMFKRAVCTKPYDYLKELIEVSMGKEVTKILKVTTSLEDLTHPIYVKNKILDVTVLTPTGKINIEINSNAHIDVRVRNFCYLANLYVNHTRRGETYDENTMFCQINLSWGLNKSKPIRGKYEITDIDTNIKYVNNFKIIEMNMDKIDNLWYHGTKEEKERYRTLLALNLSRENLSLFVEGDAMMEKFKEKMEDLNIDDDVVNFLNTKEDWEKLDRSIRLREQKELTEEVTQKVTKEATEKANKKTAKNLLKLNMSIEDIAKATGLSKKTIEQLS